MSNEAFGNVLATAAFAVIVDFAGWQMWAAMLGWSLGCVITWGGGIALRHYIDKAERRPK